MSSYNEVDAVADLFNCSRNMAKRIMGRKRSKAEYNARKHTVVMLAPLQAAPAGNDNVAPAIPAEAAAVAA